MPVTMIFGFRQAELVGCKMEQLLSSLDFQNKFQSFDAILNCGGLFVSLLLFEVFGWFVCLFSVN